MKLRTTRRVALGAVACSIAGLVIAAAPVPTTAPAPAATMAPTTAPTQSQDGAHARGDIAPAGLIAIIRPTENAPKVKGVVRFVEEDGAVRVTAQIEGLKPGSKHGFHVHEFGDASAPDATSAGDHFNPEDHPHDLPPQSRRHAGDLGNLEADDSGRADCEMVVENLTLTGGAGAILGRAVIVHAEPDDGGQPTGNAGDRIGIGVIGIAKSDR